MAFPWHLSPDSRATLAQTRRGLASDDRAIERVLDAERAAERAVAEAAVRAEQLVADARRLVRGIGERADERIKKLRARSASVTDATVARLRREHEERARASERGLADEPRLAAAVERVAAWLLGDDAERGGPRSRS